MKPLSFRFPLCCLILSLLPTTSWAEEKTERAADQAENAATEEEPKSTNQEEEKPEKPKLKTHQVGRQPLKIDVQLDGVFVAEQSEAVALRPEVWKTFTVVEVVEHGATVKKGEVLVKFDSADLEKQLEAESIQQRLSELALMELEEELPRKQKLLEIAYEQAKLAHDQLVEDIEHYKNVDRPFSVLLADQRLKSSEEDLASQEEELAQLIKMYEADDITEETEEIVLRRQRFQVERAKLYLEIQKANHKRTLNVQLPRSDESYARRLEQAELRLEEAKTAKEVGTTRGKYQLEEKRNARAKSIQRHAELLSDKALMELKAPADGIVYFGDCRDGDYSGESTLASKLKPHGSITPGTVLITIVKQRPLRVESTIKETALPDLKPGLVAEVKPGGDGNLTLAGEVSKVGAIPDGKSKFSVELDIDQDDLPSWLVAGMTCKAEVTVYENENALVVPCDLIQTDETDDEAHYVMLVVEGEKPQRREVRLGRSDGIVTEVLDGLSEGDEIVQEKKSKEDS